MPSGASSATAPGAAAGSPCGASCAASPSPPPATTRCPDVDDKTPFDGRRMALFLVASLGALYAWSLVAPERPVPPVPESAPAPVSAPVGTTGLAPAAELAMGLPADGAHVPAASEEAPRRVLVAVP